MKVATFDASRPILKPVRLFTISRADGTEYDIAECQVPIASSSPDRTWQPIGSTKLSSIRSTIGGQVPSAVLTAAMNSAGPFKPIDVMNGKFRNAKFTAYIADRDLPVPSHYFTGYVGEHDFVNPQVATFNIRGRLALGKGNMMQHYQIMCRTDLGSDLCKIPIKPADVARGTAYALGAAVRKRTLSPQTGTPQDYQNVYFEVTSAGASSLADVAYDPTVGNTTTDGTMVVTARNAWLRWAQVASLTDNGHGIVLTFLPDPRAVTSPAGSWFAGGNIHFVTGYSATEAEPIAAWNQSTFKVTVYRDMTDLVAAGDYVELHRACDFRKATCVEIFNNAKNYRGEDDFLGSDIISAPLSTPTAPSSSPSTVFIGTVTSPVYTVPSSGVLSGVTTL